MKNPGFLGGTRMKKLIAPIIIFILLLAYSFAILIPILRSPISVGVKVGIGLLGVVFLFAFVTVLVQRIQEIRKGEEDDFSQY